MTNRSSSTLPKSEELSSVGGMLTRIYWMLLGHPVVVAAAYYIASGKTAILTNTIFFLLVVSIIAARYIDIKFYRGQTAEGEPATMKHWKKFTFIVLGYSTALWILVYFVARFKLL